MEEGLAKERIIPGFFMWRDENDVLHFGVELPSKTEVSFNPSYRHTAKGLLLEEINFSSEILGCSPEELKFIRYHLHNIRGIVGAYYDMFIGSYTFKYSYPLLKELQNLDLTPAEREKVQSLINEFTYIYLIQDAQTGFIKIGYSSNPYLRLKNLIRQDTLMPTVNDFSFICFWLDYPTKERDLHKEFEEKRKRGEWFALSAEDIEKICSLHKSYSEFQRFDKNADI